MEGRRLDRKTSGWRSTEGLQAASILQLCANSTNAQTVVICDEENVHAGLCNETEVGTFILAANATETSKNTILTQAIHLKEPPAIKYRVVKTGYYCVSTYGFSAEKYKAIVEFRNAYGELPGAQIAKLPFYGGLTIVYAVIGA